jgi:hypothetical protein
MREELVGTPTQRSKRRRGRKRRPTSRGFAMADVSRECGEAVGCKHGEEDIGEELDRHWKKRDRGRVRPRDMRR